MAVASKALPMEGEMSVRTMQLEKQYERTIADSARLLDAEKDRVRRMNQLLLQFEGDNLRCQLDQANEQLLRLTETESETRLQLDEAYKEIDRLDKDVQVALTEIQRLEGELASLNKASSGYNTVVLEKKHLLQENSALKLEIERLRSQHSSRDAGYQGRHEMERELHSLEVQLENERRAHERIRAKSADQAAEILRITSRVGELQSELARELKAKQQLEQESRQHNLDWDNQKAVLQGRLDTLKKQLRATKEKLQEAQPDLMYKRNNVRNSEGEDTVPQSRTVPLQRPGVSADHHAGVTIATPGAVRVQSKVKRESALPGDKSSFSITPFLNRTGAPNDPPSSSEVDEDDMDVTMDGSQQARGLGRMNDANADQRDEPGPARGAPLKGAKAKPKARVTKPTTSAPSDKSRQFANRQEDISPEPSNEPSHPSAVNVQVKPKRRRLGAQRDRNLFEDGDEEETLVESRKAGRKLALGAGRGTSTGHGFGAPSGFSPLKRDRKRLQ